MDKMIADEALGAADGELRRRIVNFLHSRNVPGVHQVRIDAASGTIFLHGRVPSTQARRLCVECCRRVAGVIRLIDGLEVPEAHGLPRPEEAN